MKERLTIILYLLTFVTYGQDYPLPKMKAESNAVKEFSPKGWFVSHSIHGDLNEVQREDVVFILQKKDSLGVVDKDGDNVKILPRTLAIAFRTADGKYVLIETNNQVLIDNNFPPTYDPSFNAIKIESNVLSLKFAFDYVNGNFYFYTYKFHFQKNQFLLIGAETEYVTRRNMNYEKATYNFLTNKWSWTTGVHSTDQDSSKGSESVEWFTLDLKQMRTLKSMRPPGSWEVTKNKHL